MAVARAATRWQPGFEALTLAAQAFGRIADLGRKALTTASSVST